MTPNSPCAEFSSWYVTPNSRCAESSSQCVPPNSRCAESSSQCVPPNSRCVPPNYRSTSMAIPCPTPMHSAAIPRLLAGHHGAPACPGCGPARPDGVPQGDRSAVDVDPRGVQLEAPQTGERLRSERLVELHEVQVAHRPARAGERLLARRDRPLAHEAGVDPRGGERHDARQRLELVCLQGLLAHDEHGRRAVVDGRAVARVTVPPLRNAGCSFARPSRVTSPRGDSSFAKSTGSPFF